MKVEDMVPADYNPRVLSDKERADLTTSLEKFGQAEPLVVNTDGTIIGGHQRVSVLADLGVEEADVMVPDRKLSPQQEKELNVRLNKNTGSWDWAKLKEFFKTDELIGYGFEDSELKRWFGIAGLTDSDVDVARMPILTVLPPEAPRLKERVYIGFRDFDTYKMVKDWIVKNEDKATQALIDLAS
jgi:site-specific DNA-methyltransferase (adenine-specific)